MLALGLGYEGEVVGGFVEASVFTQFAVGEQALRGVGELDQGERRPEVFAEGGGDSFFAEEGKLFY